MTFRERELNEDKEGISPSKISGGKKMGPEKLNNQEGKEQELDLKKSKVEQTLESVRSEHSQEFCDKVSDLINEVMGSDLSLREKNNALSWIDVAIIVWDPEKDELIDQFKEILLNPDRGKEESA